MNNYEKKLVTELIVTTEKLIVAISSSPMFEIPKIIMELNKKIEKVKKLLKI